MTPAYRHPPVEPALCHRGSPTVAGEGWGAQSRALAAVAGPGHPPDCVLAQGTPPWFHPHTTVRSRAPGRQWGSTQHNTTQHSTAQHSTAQHSTAQHSTAQHNTTQHNTTQQHGRGHDFNEAPVRSRTGAMSSMGPQCEPAEEPRVQCSPSALTHRGQESNETPVRSRAGARISMRPGRGSLGSYWADHDSLIRSLQVPVPCTRAPAVATHSHTARAQHTQPSRLPVPVGRHPGHCLLVTAPSAQHNTTQHNTRQHGTTQQDMTRHNTT